MYIQYHFRSNPDFKKKLRERRRLAAKRAAASRGPKLPDFSDQEAVQRFFLQEVGNPLAFFNVQGEQGFLTLLQGDSFGRGPGLG